ncbi:MAG: hypothetical protein A3I66_22950 [Burkholderiales bacterium RIFCSPLOWO2_02_FULL_57_36]|nr:MAG: hypothetical protein A3I66_22950 [Burkholderiales bacterium RIFCSPLOWO2_02_FULL_57_36]
MESREAEKPIRLQTLRISSEISRGMAETTVQMVFFNPNSRPLEGNLQFPLLDGQQITAFALDIDGKRRPAVTVEKAKGRKIFEAIVKRSGETVFVGEFEVKPEKSAEAGRGALD